jgi:hypothetical protein
MGEPRGRLHVSRVRSTWTRKDGTTGTCESVLLRQCWREDGKVKTNTVASLTSMPPSQVDSLEAVLNHRKTATVIEGATLGPGLRHGDVAAVWAMAAKTGLPRALGPACRERDVALALVAARICHPASKASQATWWADTTMGVDLGLAGISTDEVYSAMDWLVDRQDAIEAELAAKHLTDQAANPNALVMFDLSSTWVEGNKCELAAFGYSRDKKRGKAQIEFALVANPEGIPVAVRVFPGNTADPSSFVHAVEAVREKFSMGRAVMVGDRGMVTGTRIDEMRGVEGLEWIGALKHAQIAALAADDGPLQMTLFDQQDLAEATDPAYPGERLIMCRNPFTAARSKAKRERLVAATIADLAKVAGRVERGTLTKEDDIALEVGKVIGRHKVAKLVTFRISKTRVSYGRNNAAIAAEAALDGIYVIRTSLDEDSMAATEVLGSYTRLSHVEQDFAWAKSVDIAVRPVWHRRADRVTAHLLICMLAVHITWHLRKAWAPLTFTDTEPPGPSTSPSAPAKRSEAAAHKASTRRTPENRRARSFHGLLSHLGTMTRNTIRIDTPEGGVEFTRVSQPTADQAEAFRLIGAPIPQTIA